MAKHAEKVEKRSHNAVRRPSRAPETRDGGKHGNRHHEQAGAPLGRPAAPREGSGARHWEKRRLADPHIQRGGEEGAEGGVWRLLLPLGSCGVRCRRGLSAPTLGLWLIRAQLGGVYLLAGRVGRLSSQMGGEVGLLGLEGI